MAEQRKRAAADDRRPEREARKVMDETLRRMLAMPPDPHAAPKKKPAKQARKHPK